jgi:hypothetical protein
MSQILDLLLKRGLAISTVDQMLEDMDQMERA